MAEATILDKVEEVREKMIQSGIENGLQNITTIKLSHKLDALLNLYDKCQVTQGNETHVSEQKQTHVFYKISDELKFF